MIHERPEKRGIIVKNIVVILCMFAAGCGPSAADINEADRVKAEAAHAETMRELDRKKAAIDAKAASDAAETNRMRDELKLRSLGDSK